MSGGLISSKRGPLYHLVRAKIVAIVLRVLGQILRRFLVLEKLVSFGGFNILVVDIIKGSCSLKPIRIVLNLLLLLILIGIESLRLVTARFL